MTFLKSGMNDNNYNKESGGGGVWGGGFSYSLLPAAVKMWKGIARFSSSCATHCSTFASMPLPMILLNETISGLKKESVYDALSNVYHQWFVYHLFFAFSSSMSATFWFYLPISFQFIAISVMPWHYFWYFILLHNIPFPEFKILV